MKKEGERKFASNYLFLEGQGFLKLQVVELQGNYVSSIRPLTKEMESIEWVPGVIVLTKEKEPSDWFAAFPDTTSLLLDTAPVFLPPNALYAHLLYPFDFKEMQPVAETLHRLLP